MGSKERIAKLKSELRKDILCAALAILKNDGRQSLSLRKIADRIEYKSGAHNYMEYDKSEIDNIKDNAIFIFTHKHADHYSEKILKKLKGQKFDPSNIDELEKLGTSIAAFDIKAFRTQHKVFGISFKHYSFLITWHGKKIYISGDTGDLEDLSQLKEIDWAFVNPWIYMNAVNEKLIIDAKNFGMYHLYPDQAISGEVPSNLLILKKQGEIINIPY